MEFCKDCGGLLMPKKGVKNKMYCKVCEKTTAVKDKKILEKYGTGNRRNIQRKTRKTRRNVKTMVVAKPEKKRSITAEEREALEDMFSSGD